MARNSGRIIGRLTKRSRSRYLRDSSRCPTGSRWSNYASSGGKGLPEAHSASGQSLFSDSEVLLFWQWRKQARRRGVIYAVAPSPLEINLIWCGTDDGLIHLTADGGKTWNDVTPPAISAWQKISVIEAGHFDADTAYAAVNTLRLDDLRPHIFATHDRGKTWTEIVKGIPTRQIVNAVREDPQGKGLLFAGTETGVYMSFNDGASWESLRLNLPATSVRDLIVKTDDLVIGTHGRGFWILDNITPLRHSN